MISATLLLQGTTIQGLPAGCRADRTTDVVVIARPLAARVITADLAPRAAPRAARPAFRAGASAIEARQRRAAVAGRAAIAVGDARVIAPLGSRRADATTRFGVGYLVLRTVCEGACARAVAALTGIPGLAVAVAGSVAAGLPVSARHRLATVGQADEAVVSAIGVSATSSRGDALPVAREGALRANVAMARARVEDGIRRAGLRRTLTRACSEFWRERRITRQALPIITLICPTRAAVRRALFDLTAMGGSTA